jgi:hypothetical protein
VTLQEARRHLGVETHRPWLEVAIERTIPVHLGLFSLVTLVDHERLQWDGRPIRQAVWYAMEHATFAETPALVRDDLWAQLTFRLSAQETDMVNVPRAMVQRLTDTLFYAA